MRSFKKKMYFWMYGIKYSIYVYIHYAVIKIIISRVIPSNSRNPICYFLLSGFSPSPMCVHVLCFKPGGKNWATLFGLLEISKAQIGKVLLIWIGGLCWGRERREKKLILRQMKMNKCVCGMYFFRRQLSCAKLFSQNILAFGSRQHVWL